MLMLKHKIIDYRQEIELLDGRKVTLRTICSGDKSALISFHHRLSEDTRFLRYQYLKNELTEADLKSFCDIDYNNNLALVAEAEINGCLAIIGIGQYYRTMRPQTAEVAFVVQDNEQGKGIGTQLVKHLAILAWQHNIHYFTAEVMRMNWKMLSIFRKSDPEIVNTEEGRSTCTVTFRVAEAMYRTPHNGDFHRRNSQNRTR
jgi:GNAT superfamily N-acetyltransferase